MTKWVCVRRGDDLQHHGIKGMKWGRRRYQNADGSLTPAGKQRYSDGEKSVDDYKRSIKNFENAGKAVDSVRKFNDDVKRVKDPSMEKKIRKSTEGMTDKELQQAVQRLNMEDNYTRMMMHREHLKQGEDYVSRFLDISSTFIKGATTTLTIAVLVKELLKK